MERGVRVCALERECAGMSVFVFNVIMPLDHISD